jgi:sporulation protein YlmC with PRC-barrel domain
MIIMLYKAKTLSGYTLRSLDGDIGNVKEFYLDDHHWTVRYLVVNTGHWITGRQVLISPYAITAVNKEEQYISINLTKKQIEDSPSLNDDKPISRQFEESYRRYYGMPMYWSGPYLWGAQPVIVHDPKMWSESIQGEESWNPNLRSTSAMSGYDIQSPDGEIGHVEDFVIDDETWTIRYLVIDTKNWLPGKKVLISPQWIECVSWDQSIVFVNLSRNAIKQSPEYSEKALLNRDYEIEIFKHYHRQAYWGNEIVSKKHSR